MLWFQRVKGGNVLGELRRCSLKLSSICFCLLQLHDSRTARALLFLPIFHLSFPCGSGQSWETNRNKLSALQEEPSSQPESRGRKEQWEERWRGGGEVEMDRFRSANENLCDSWKQLVWLTSSENLKLPVVIYCCKTWHYITLGWTGVLNIYIERSAGQNVCTQAHSADRKRASKRRDDGLWDGKAKGRKSKRRETRRESSFGMLTGPEWDVT